MNPVDPDLRDDYFLGELSRTNNELANLQREMACRNAELAAAEKKLQTLNEHLEQQVASRTADLFIVTQEAQLANRAKSELLSRTSHELRTPLNAILGFGQLLEMEEDPGSESHENIRQILAAGEHLLSLINEVLDISDAESGRMRLTLETVAVDRLVEETLGLVRPLAATLQIELEGAVSRGCNVLADAERLKGVLFNLLSNAIKYNRPGGKVSVGCAPTAAGHAARFCVTDDGPGISADKLTRLFTPFDRLDAERTPIAGSGLGLALSKRMIELMDGRIGVESVAGEGSTFWIELPTAERPREDNLEAAAEKLADTAA